VGIPQVAANCKLKLMCPVFVWFRTKMGHAGFNLQLAAT
jgi:hypothetical protein